MKYTVFCFTGTGNSLYFANSLCINLENSTIVPLHNNTIIKEIGGEDHSIGFIFPSYFGNLPRVVKEYISHLTILPNTYIFSMVTMGAVGQGSISALQKLLKEKGHVLSYGRGVRMAANYVMKYNPTSEQKSMALNVKSTILAKNMAKDIQIQHNLIHKNFITTNYLYKNIHQLDNHFYTDNHCNGCGICQKICPVNNIDLINKTPHWAGHCEHCTACINTCPEKSIQYTNKTLNRRRYRNPSILLSSLIKFKTHK